MKEEKKVLIPIDDIIETGWIEEKIKKDVNDLVDNFRDELENVIKKVFDEFLEEKYPPKSEKK